MDWTLNIFALVFGGVYGLVAGLVALKLTATLVMAKSDKYNKGLKTAYNGRKEQAVIVAVHFGLCLFFGALLPAGQAICACVLVSAAVVGGVIDNKIRIIPNELVLAVAVVGLALRCVTDIHSVLPALLTCVIATAVCLLLMGIMKALRGTVGMGAGDLKMIMACSLAAGWPGIITYLVGLCLALMVVCYVKIFVMKEGMKSKFPMCIPLMVGLLVAVAAPQVHVLAAFLGVW